jgi:hypothetical protein
VLKRAAPSGAVGEAGAQEVGRTAACGIRRNERALEPLARHASRPSALVGQPRCRDGTHARAGLTCRRGSVRRAAPG